MLFTLDENSFLGVYVMAELALGIEFTSTEDAIACVNRKCSARHSDAALTHSFSGEFDSI